MPVLAIAGGKGVGAPMVDAVRLVADNVRGVVMDGCGHYVPEEAPDRLLAELRAFLA